MHGIQLDSLAEEYEHRCESYDRLICYRGIPKTSYDLHMINKNSRHVLLDIAKRENISVGALKEAICHYGRVVRR